MVLHVGCCVACLVVADLLCTPVVYFWLPAAIILQVKMHLKGKTTHHEQQQQKKQEEKAAAKAAKSGKLKAAGANGPSPAAAAANGTAGGAEAGAGQQLLVCGSCGEQAQGLEAAKAHAAATGHTDYEEVVAV